MNHPLDVYHCFTFFQLDSLINLRFLRLKVGRDVNDKAHIEKVYFIKIKGNAGISEYETEDVYEIRCTDSMRTAIWEYIITKKVWQRKYYGEKLKEDYDKKPGGSSGFRYYDLPDFHELFSKAFVCGYMHTEDSSSILAMFFKEDMEEREETDQKHHVIWIPMTDEELKQHEIAKQMQEDPGADYDPDFEDWENESGKYGRNKEDLWANNDKDSWMDNDDDHWNVD